MKVNFVIFFLYLNDMNSIISGFLTFFYQVLSNYIKQIIIIFFNIKITFCSINAKQIANINLNFQNYKNNWEIVYLRYLIFIYIFFFITILGSLSVNIGRNYSKIKWNNTWNIIYWLSNTLIMNILKQITKTKLYLDIEKIK